MKTIYVVLNHKGGKDGNLTYLCEAFTKQEDAEKCVEGHPHLIWASCPLDRDADYGSIPNYYVSGQDREDYTDTQDRENYTVVPIKKGDKVLWSDPDEDISSGTYIVQDVNGEVLTLVNEKGSEVQAFTDECSLLFDSHPERN